MLYGLLGTAAVRALPPHLPPVGSVDGSDSVATHERTQSPSRQRLAGNSPKGQPCSRPVHTLGNTSKRRAPRSQLPEVDELQPLPQPADRYNRQLGCYPKDQSCEVLDLCL